MPQGLFARVRGREIGKIFRYSYLQKMAGNESKIIKGPFTYAEEMQIYDCRLGLKPVFPFSWISTFAGMISWPMGQGDSKMSRWIKKVKSKTIGVLFLFFFFSFLAVSQAGLTEQVSEAVCPMA